MVGNARDWPLLVFFERTGRRREGVVMRGKIGKSRNSGGGEAKDFLKSLLQVRRKPEVLSV